MNLRTLHSSVWITIGLFFLVNTISSAQIIYVKQGGTGNGSSWQNALDKLPPALALAKPGYQIWVAQGIYTPTICKTCSTDDRKASFIISDSVRVYGGFNGTETKLEQRDWKKNITTLSGDIDNDGKLERNSMRLVYTINVSSITTLDGFTLRDGNANDSTVVAGEYFNSGGAFFNDGRFSASSPTITNCIFTNNYALGFGGALYNDAAFKGKCNAQISNCTFKNNRAHSVGGAVHNSGNNGGYCNAHFEWCTFDSNTSDESGGAVFNDGDNGVNQTFFLNCKFNNNYGIQYGGAMYNLGNHGDASPAILNCLFWNNASYAGGAIYNLGSNKGKANSQIVNCTFYKNTGHTSGVIYANAGDTTGSSVPTIVNSIFWGNTGVLGKIFRTNYGTPKISYCIVDTADCNGLNSGLGTGVVCGSGLRFNQNPIFENPDSGNFHLKPGSFAINAGDTSIIKSLNLKYDIDSAARVLDTVVDLGCFEYTAKQFFAPEIVDQPQTQPVCDKESAQIIFKVSGTPPLAFNWFKKNKLFAVTSTDTLNFKISSVADTGYYYAVVTNSKNQTIKTDSIYLRIKPFLPLSVELVVLKLPVCAFDSITIQANILNGGNKPKLNWMLNNSSLGFADSLLTITTPVGSSFFKYQCVFTSSEKCTIQNPITSKTLSVNVSDSVAMSAKMTNPMTIDKGKPATFKIDGTNLGMQPLVKWFVNGKNVLNASGLNYTTDSLKSKDIVSATVISALSCAKPAQTTLTAPTVIFTGETDLKAEAIDARIYPNPLNSNELRVLFSTPHNIQNVSISDVSGKNAAILIQLTQTNSDEWQLYLPELSTGVYFLRIETPVGILLEKFIKL